MKLLLSVKIISKKYLNIYNFLFMLMFAKGMVKRKYLLWRKYV